MYKIKELAQWGGVSIRTLHHYDQIGLLKPEQTGDNGYRYYSDQSLERLQQILFFKELGFSLREIQAILDHPAFDRASALRAQYELLAKQKQRLETMMQTVQQTLQSLETGQKLKIKEMFQNMSKKAIEDHKQKYAQEVKERWGQTDAYQQSQKKTAQYSAADWERIQTRTQGIYQQIVAGMNLGPEAPEVQAAVADLRQSISDYYYDCSPEIFKGLGEMYVADARFTAYFEKIQPGLATFLSQAIAHYCASGKA